MPHRRSFAAHSIGWCDAVRSCCSAIPQIRADLLDGTDHEIAEPKMASTHLQRWQNSDPISSLSRWCANGLRSAPSSWFLQSPPPNGDRHTQTCHSIEHIASDLGFGALIEQIPSAKSSANDGLVAIDCCLNQAPSIVTRSTLPAYSTMVRNHRNMPVALTRRRPVRNCCYTRRDDNHSRWMSFGHSIVDRRTIVRTIGRQ